MARLRRDYWRNITVVFIVGLFLLWGALGPVASQAAGESAEEVTQTEKAVEQAVEKAEEPERPQFSGSVDMLSQYVWRGLALSRDSVVFQPSMTVSYKGFAVNLWGNFDTNEQNPFGAITPNRNAAKWNETDVTVSYSKEVIKNLTLTGGIIYYALDSNNAAFDSFEVYGGFDYAFPWFNVGFGVYKEVANLPGWYLNWYITRSFDLPVNLPSPLGQPTLDLYASWSAELSTSKAAFPTDDGSFYQSLHAGQLMAAINFPIGKYFTFSPKIIYWYALGGQSTYTIRNLSWDGTQNHILGGGSLSINF
jgi:hypothetical protein